jgi:hypothetical protein
MLDDLSPGDVSDRIIATSGRRLAFLVLSICARETIVSHLSDNLRREGGERILPEPVFENLLAASLGHPVLRMTAFHIPDLALTIVATKSRYSACDLRLYRSGQNGHKSTKGIESASTQSINIYFIFSYLQNIVLVGLQGFEPRTKGL